jgi:hypothetical protein
MSNSNETLKPQQKIRKTHGEITMREHLPIALEEIRALATCGLSTCGQCETTLRIVESMQKFVRNVTDSLESNSIDGLTMLAPDSNTGLTINPVIPERRRRRAL